MLVKICGVTTIKEARDIVELGADLIGLNFCESAKNQIADLEARKIIEAYRDQSIGIFDIEDFGQVARRARELNLKWVQIYAPFALEKLADLKDFSMLLNIRVGKDGQYQKRGYELPKNAYWLFDGPRPGSGISFCWESFENEEQGTFFVAGGLKSSNVKEAVVSLSPVGVDVDSSVTHLSGVLKDLNKVKEFIEIAKIN